MPRRNTIEVIIAGKDKGTVSLLGKVAGGLGGIAKYALGDLLAGGIRAVGQALGGLAKNALAAVGHAQNLELAMEGLLTESLMYQRVQETTQSIVHLSAAEQKRLNTAMQQSAKLAATVAQQEIGLAEAKRKKGESEAAYQARLEKMRVTLEVNQERVQLYTRDIANLTQKQGALTTSTEMVWKQTLEYGQANEQAKKEVEGLLAFIEELAITSPFAARQVEEVAKLGLSAKMSTEEVQDFTQAFLDYSAVHGITSENLAFAADQFLQLRKAGKLSAIDLRQLRRLGIDVSQVLGVKMAMSVEEFNERIGESPELMDELFESFIEMAKEGTAGAAKRMAMTVGGMMATVQDIIQVGSKKLFRPLVEAIGPVMAEVIDTIAGFITGGELAKVGERIGEWATSLIGYFKGVVEDGDFLNEWLDKLPEEIQPAVEWIGKLTAFLLDLFAGEVDWEDILPPWVLTTIEGITTAVETVGSWLDEFLPKAIEIASSAWEDLLLPALKDVWELIEEKVVPVLTDLWEWLEKNIPLAIEALVPLWEELLLPALQGLWEFVKIFLIPILIGLGIALLIAAAPFILTALAVVLLGAALIALGLLWHEYGDQVTETVEQIKFIIIYALNEAAQKVTEWYGEIRTTFSRLKFIIVYYLNKAAKKVTEWYEELKEIFAELKFIIVFYLNKAAKKVTDWRDTVVKAFNKVKRVIGDLIRKAEALWKKFTEVQLPSWMKPGSPTPLELGLRGIADALREVSEVSLPMFNARMGQMGGMGETNTNYYFNQTVNTRATQANVMQDWALAQALAG